MDTVISGGRVAALPKRPSVFAGRGVRGRAEPWRDWAVLAAINHGLLIAIVIARPGWPWLVAAAVPLGLGLATGTLTVLHDAGHRRFARRGWPNVLAVQTAVPVGLWVGHWTLKHRVHHQMTQVYPVDEATRSSGLVRLHESAPRRRVHRFQHMYAWFLYGLAWAGELRSQLTYVRTGHVTGTDTPPTARRAVSFAVEKGLWLLVLAPYAVAMGMGRLAVLLVVAMTVASLIAAVITVVGHINVDVRPGPGVPSPQEWAGHVVRTTASFATANPLARWLTGGLTHHLAHHLRPVAPRGDLPALHATIVAETVADCGVPQVEFPSFTSAVHGHWQRLKELGQPAPPQARPIPETCGRLPRVLTPR